MFRSLFRRSLQSPTRQNDTAHGRVRLGLECLESREVPAFFTVMSNGDEGGIGNLATLTLRQAINRANDAVDGTHYINFALPGADHVIPIGSQLPAIQCNHLYIHGTITVPGADGSPPVHYQVTVERPSTAPGYRLFEVASSATLSGLKLRGGNVEGFGGAILSIGHLTLSGCVVRDNEATAGGGVAVTLGTLQVYDSDIRLNRAGVAGGGIYFFGSQMEVAHTLIRENTSAGSGGGLCLDSQTAPDITTVKLNHVEVTNNSATHLHGGGIYSAATSVLVTGGSVINSNTAWGENARGGGVYLEAGTMTFDGVSASNNGSWTGNFMFVSHAADYVEVPGGLTRSPFDDIVVAS
jgi:predicted outer membrane repeat protein